MPAGRLGWRGQPGERLGCRRNTAEAVSPGSPHGPWAIRGCTGAVSSTGGLGLEALDGSRVCGTNQGRK